MAEKSGSLLFPFKENPEGGLERTYTTNTLVKSCMSLFLVTSPGQRRGNNKGSILPSLKNQLIRQEDLSIYADKIKQELVENFPGVFVSRVTLSYLIQDSKVNQTVLEVKVEFSAFTNNLETFSILI